jgi:tetratricopeptide (TPR) repeat protein
MEKRLTTALLTSLSLFSLSPAGLSAQDANENFRPGARALALGGSLVVQARDPSAIFWNPAILSGFRDRELLINFNDPFEFNFVGVTQFVPLYGTLGLALSRIPTNAAGVDRGTLAWGVKMFERFSMGANFNLSKQDNDWYAHGSAGLFLGKPVIGSLGRHWNDIPTTHTLDRLNIGLMINHIPLGGSLFDPTANLGLSYLFPKAGLLINTGHHVHRGDDTSHLGVGIQIPAHIMLSAGIEDLDVDKAGLGMSYTHDNFLFSVTYSTNSERFVLSMAARLSPSPATLAKPYYDKGYQLHRGGKSREAVHQLRKYLSFELDDSASDSTRRLVRGLEQRFARDQVLIDTLFARVDRLIQGGDLGLAGIALTRILDMDPGNERARINLIPLTNDVQKYIAKIIENGTKYFEEKKYQEAEEAFRLVLLVEKDNFTATNYLARLSQAYSELADEHFYRGLGYFRQENYIRSKEEFSQAIELRPEWEEAESYLARSEDKLKELRDEVVEMIRKGEEHERQGRHYDAANLYLEVLQKDPDNETTRQRLERLKPQVSEYLKTKSSEGMEQLRKGNYARARESFSRVLSLDPENSEAKRGMQELRNSIANEIALNLSKGDEAMQKSEWKVAFDFYSQVLKTDPQNDRASQGKGKAQSMLEVSSLIAQGQTKMQAVPPDFVNAIASFESALRLDSNNQVAQNALKDAIRKLDEEVERKYLEGISLFAKDQYQEAIDKWNEVLKMKPNHQGALDYKQQANERVRALKKLK